VEVVIAKVVPNWISHLPRILQNFPPFLAISSRDGLDPAFTFELGNCCSGVHLSGTFFQRWDHLLGVVVHLDATRHPLCHLPWV
jgi:hypothetical protein